MLFTFLHILLYLSIFIYWSHMSVSCGLLLTYNCILLYLSLLNQLTVSIVDLTVIVNTCATVQTMRILSSEEIRRQATLLSLFLTAYISYHIFIYMISVWCSFMVLVLRSCSTPGLYPHCITQSSASPISYCIWWLSTCLQCWSLVSPRSAISPSVTRFTRRDCAGQVEPGVLSSPWQSAAPCWQLYR